MALDFQENAGLEPLHGVCRRPIGKPDAGAPQQFVIKGRIALNLFNPVNGDCLGQPTLGVRHLEAIVAKRDTPNPCATIPLTRSAFTLVDCRLGRLRPRSWG